MKDAYQELYLTCFPEDTPEDAAHLFKGVFSKAICLERKVAGRPIAMLYLMDCNLVSANGVAPFYYLYAACTHPDFRVQGIMGQLLAEAKQVAIQNGKQGIFLKPANRPLFDFYQKSAFLPFFAVCKLQISTQAFGAFCQTMPLQAVSADPCSMEEWYDTRRTLLPRLTTLYADFPKSLLLGATDGCQALRLEGAGLVYEIREDTLLVKEALVLPEKEPALFSLLYDLLGTTGCRNLELRLPATACSPALQQLGGRVEPFSVIWSAKPIPTTQTPYHGFAFD